MREREVRVVFEPLGKTVYVLEGTRLVEAAAGAGLALDLPCGGEGMCGKCQVIVRQGTAEPTAIELDTLTPEEIEQGVRLACESVVSEPTTVEVPETSLLASYHKILATAEGAPPAATDPAVCKKYVELTPPQRGDDEPDLVRMERALGEFEIDLEVVRKLPETLRREKFRGTAVLANRRLIDFEPGNTEAQCLGVAFDIGTTTLVGMLVDLATGREMAVASRLNPQTGFGDDVITRIQHATGSSQGLGELHEEVVEACDEMIGELAETAAVAREQIYELTFAGNTTMLQLLCRIDPRFLGEMPFVPAMGRHLVARANRLAMRIHPRGQAYVFPVIGGFVGGDTVAGILATGLVQLPEPTLLIDIGTNGEIVLFSKGKLLAAAAAAGPAFEGARLTHGMRGCTGAIEKVILDGSVRINVIGDTAPVGYCGSALVDLAAGLLDHGILATDGRLVAPDDLPANLPAELRRRVTVYNEQAAFLLVPETESATGKPIVLTQRDVRQLQLASGAIRAGILLLLKRAGLKPLDLQAILMAGGFGNFIRRSNAQRIGLLPGDVPHSHILYQGNTSLAGARLAAISCEARRRAEHLARRTEHVDLSTDHDFQWTFADAMIFPEQ